jgi:hypothetical protein
VRRTSPLATHGGEPLRRRERQHRLADPRAVGGHPATDPRRDARPLPSGQFLHLDDVQPVRDGEVHRLVRRLEQVGEEWGRRLARTDFGGTSAFPSVERRARAKATPDGTLVVRPYLDRWPKMDRNAIVQGWAGVYSSFLLHAEAAAERYKVPAHAILRRCGEIGLVGGQEDMIIDVAIQLAAERASEEA